MGFALPTPTRIYGINQTLLLVDPGISYILIGTTQLFGKWNLYFFEVLLTLLP
jgi:hypothetical protein